MSNSPARTLPLGPGLASARDRGGSGTGAAVIVGLRRVGDNESEVLGSASHGGQSADELWIRQWLNALSAHRLPSELWKVAQAERELSRHDRLVLFEGGRFVAYRHGERVGDFGTADEAQDALKEAA